MDDTYKTITAASEGLYKEKMSKFLSFAEPCRTAQEALDIVKLYRNEYCDARHCCWAYMLGPERREFRSNDDGEPSGTAGKPILGQINSAELTDILIIVVRYFGGVKLGTSGLTQAYKTVAAEAIANASVEERTVDDLLDVSFEYPFMNAVMRVVKEEGPQVLGQSFDNNCVLHLRIRKSLSGRLQKRFEDLRCVKVEVLD